MLIVDSQIHLWTQPTAPPHHRQVPYRAEDAIRDMDEAGIDRAVNCPAIWDADANDYAVEAVRRHPGRFATLGWFPLSMSPNPEFVERFLARPGMLGLRFVLMRPEDVAAFGDGRLDWVWEVADRLRRPVGIILPKPSLASLGDVASRFPGIPFLVDHLNAMHYEKLPVAMDHMPVLRALAERPNVAMKASGAPSMSNEAYPFADVSPYLEQVFDLYGPDRMFFGTDFTRLGMPLRDCVTMFTDHLPWLRGDDLEKVMGRALCSWIGWDAA